MTTSEDGAADQTPPTMTYEFDSNGDVILPTVRTREVGPDDRLPIFQYIDKSVLGYRIDRGVTLVVIIGVDGIRKQHRIYMYSSPKHFETKNNARIGDNTESKSMMLYICMNCVFAEWVQNQLIEFVEQLPNMYKTLNVTLDEEGNQNFFILDSSRKQHIEYIEEKTKHFISILFNFINIHSYNRVNSLVDMSLLRMLVSTNILIHYILKHNGKSKVDTIVNKILKIVTEVQTFMAYNCDIVYSYYDNKYFFSYSMTKPKTDKYHIDIDEFFNDLMAFGLETLLERYSVRQMLLGSVMTSKNDVVMNELKKARLLVMEKPVVIDEKFFQAIEESNDLDVIYWYMNIVLDAIIRLFCQKTLSQLQKKRVLNIKITEGFRILSFLFTELTIDSEKVIEAFNFLALNQELTKAQRAELITVMKNYHRKEFSLQNIDYEIDSSRMFPFFKIETFLHTLDNPGLPLEKFMNSIVNRVSDYKCFVNIFELLKIEHKHNYVSKMRNPSKVYEFVYSRILSEHEGEDWERSLYRYLNNESKIHTRSLQFRSASIDKNICELVINMYEYCVEYCLALIWDEKLKSVEINNGNNEEVSKLIDIISQVLEHIYKNLKLSDRFLIELLLDIMPVLEVKRHKKTNWDSEKNIEFIRILYITMIELNKYGLEACTNDKDENLFFNLINYDTMGDHPNENQAILDKWITFVPTIESSIVSTLPNLYFSMEKIKTFCTDTICNKNLRFYWRGELKTFYQISDTVQFDILDPYYVYALYDVYFKFHMALLYYNLRAILDYLNSKNEFISHDQMTLFFCDAQGIKNFYINDNILSSEFSLAFKKCVNDCGYEFVIKYCYSMADLPDSCKDVEKMIKQLGIIMVLKFPYINTEPSFDEEEQRLSNRDKDKLVKQRVTEEVTMYKDNRAKSIILIAEARKEYEKFRQFYNYINFDGWSASR